MRDLDEDPSEDDIERFGGDTARCPSCGEEIHDDALACPECGVYLEDEPAHRRGVNREAQRKLNQVIVVLLIVGMLAGCACYGFLRLF